MCRSFLSMVSYHFCELSLLCFIWASQEPSKSLVMWKPTSVVVDWEPRFAEVYWETGVMGAAWCHVRYPVPRQAGSQGSLEPSGAIGAGRYWDGPGA